MQSTLRTRVTDARFPSYPFAACAVAVALCAEVLLSRFTSFPPSTTLLALAIATSAWYGGLGPGMLALLLSGIAIDYLVVEPGTFLQFSSRGQAALFACYTAGWLGFCLLTEQTVRRLQRDKVLRITAQRAARQSDRLAQLTTALGQARTPSAVIEAAVQEPLHALDADAGVVLLIRNDGGAADVARSVGHRQDVSELPATVSLTDKGLTARARSGADVELNGLTALSGSGSIFEGVTFQATGTGSDFRANALTSVTMNGASITVQATSGGRAEMNAVQ